jgi:hypothetical protein
MLTEMVLKHKYNEKKRTSCENIFIQNRIIQIIKFIKNKKTFVITNGTNEWGFAVAAL